MIIEGNKKQQVIAQMAGDEEIIFDVLFAVQAKFSRIFRLIEELFQIKNSPFYGTG